MQQILELAAHFISNFKQRFQNLSLANFNNFQILICVNFYDWINHERDNKHSYFVYYHHQRLATKPPTDGAARFAARFLRISYGISGHF